MKKIALFLSLTTALVAKELPEPYRSIKEIPFDDHGWFFNGSQLESIIKRKAPSVVIEIGSWLGTSTRFLASKISKEGLVYAIDTWQGSLSEPDCLKDPRIPQLYHIFLSNVKHAGLSEKIIPIRMDSTEASKALEVKADLIYIDADHSAISVLNDIMAWYPHLNPEGIMCGDDWKYPSVQEGVLKAANLLNKKILSDDNFWQFE